MTLMTSNELAEFRARNPGVKYLNVLFADASGRIRGKAMPFESVDKILSDGLPMPIATFGFDIWGRDVPESRFYDDLGDCDVIGRAAAQTLVLDPWVQVPTASLIGTLCGPDGRAHPGDTRALLAGLLDRLRSHGLSPCVAFEFEFYLTDPETDEPITGLRRAPPGTPPLEATLDMEALGTLAPFFESVREAAASMRLPIDTITSEFGAGQFEINLRHQTDALLAADQALTFRRMIKGVAEQHGMRATFMAKPFGDEPGSGLHLHVSLLGEDGRNGLTPDNLLMRQSISGCLATMHDFTACFVPTVNGYRRIVPDANAPATATWGLDNRSVALRIPKGPAYACRLEHRVSGGDANPYLVLAAVVAGIVHGIEEPLELPPAVSRNANATAPAEARLPNSLERAVELLHRSRAARSLFGKEFVDLYCGIKSAEVRAFGSYVSPFERSAYF